MVARHTNSISYLDHPGSDREFLHEGLRIEQGIDALALRVSLIREARCRIDLQTFLWKDDAAGRLCAYEIMEAARRGVAVRLLIDGWASDGALFPEIVTLEPRIRARFYNPPTFPPPFSALAQAVNVVADFERMNHRMHNKIFVVDDSIAIVGGRNYEDTYFDNSAEMNFRDREVLITGPTVQKLSASFHIYWTHDLSRELLVPESAPRTDTDGRFRSGRAVDDELCRPLALRLDQQLSKSAGLKCQVRGLRPLRHVEVIADPPGPYYGTTLSQQALLELFRSATTELILQTPYFILDNSTFATLQELRRRAPSLRIIVSTNSLASTDNVVAYSLGARDYSQLLRELAVEIFEYRPFPDRSQTSIDASASYPRRCLHAKTFVIDQKIAIVGSANIDPRSAALNSETCVLVDDPSFVHALKREIQTDISPINSWVIAESVIEPERGEASCFELIPGREPVGPRSPRFHSRYRPVGRFPGVTHNLRQLAAQALELVGPLVKPLV